MTDDANSAAPPPSPEPLIWHMEHIGMICRMWHGRTPHSKADDYAKFLEQRAIPDYRSIPGNLNVVVLRRDDGDVTHFLTVTQWDSEDSIRAFAGDDLLKAKYYPEDQDYLLEFEPFVQHYTVIAAENAILTRKSSGEPAST